MLFSALALTSSAVMAIMPASAEEFGPEGVTAEQVASVLRDEGYKALIGTDDIGEPMIETALSGLKVFIYFYECENEKCTDIQFSVAWDFEDGVPIRKIAEWNETNRFGKAFLDEERDPVLDIDLQLAPGGTPALIAAYLPLVEVVVDAFENHVYE